MVAQGEALVFRPGRRAARRGMRALTCGIRTNCSERFSVRWKLFESNFATIGAFAFGEYKLCKAEWAIRPAVLGFPMRRTQKFFRRHSVFCKKGFERAAHRRIARGLRVRSK